MKTKLSRGRLPQNASRADQKAQPGDHEYLRRRLRPHGLTVGQINILVAVAQAGEATPREIGANCCWKKSTLSAHLEL
jgi:DNA-binding MarR family transcriptional regulator